MRPLVSVIIPAYNAARYVADAINSVLSQTYKDYEMIVVNDGSADDTASIVKNIISSIDHKPYITDRRPEIRYIYQKNSGPSAARNRGITESLGEYIAFLDSDDAWEPDKLEKQVKALEANHNIGLATCGRKVFDQSDNQTISMPNIPTDRNKMFNSFAMGNIVGSCSCVIIRRSCIGVAGNFDELLNVGEDWDMWFRIARDYEIATINEPLVKYRIRQNSQSGCGNRNLENELRLLKRIFDEQAVPYTERIKKKAYSYRHYKAAIAYKENGDILKMKEAILKSIFIYPLGLLDHNILSFFVRNILILRRRQTMPLKV